MSGYGPVVLHNFIVMPIYRPIFHSIDPINSVLLIWAIDHHKVNRLLYGECGCTVHCP